MLQQICSFQLQIYASKIQMQISCRFIISFLFVFCQFLFLFVFLFVCEAMIQRNKIVAYPGFFGMSRQFVQISISLKCHHGWHRGGNFEYLFFWISGNCLSGVFLVHFLRVISAIFFVIKLVVFVLSYVMSSIALVFKGQKILFRSFLVRLGENFLKV